MRRFGRWFCMLFLLVMVTGIFTVCAQAVDGTAETESGITFSGESPREEEPPVSGPKEPNTLVTPLPQTGWESNHFLPMAGAVLLLLIAGFCIGRSKEERPMRGRPAAGNRRKHQSLYVN